MQTLHTGAHVLPQAHLDAGLGCCCLPAWYRQNNMSLVRQLLAAWHPPPGALPVAVVFVGALKDGVLLADHDAVVP
jgi:hypothetical protein